MAQATIPLDKHGRYLCLGLLLIFLVHAPSLSNGFARDDRLAAKASLGPGTVNPLIAELAPISTYFSTKYWRGLNDSDRLFRPVSVLSYALVYNGVGRFMSENLEALPQHLLNILLCLACVLLLYFLLLPMTGRNMSAVISAVLFGLHALNSEVVAAIAGRADLFAFAFGAAALLSHQRAWSMEGTKRLAWLLLSSSLLFLAFCAKESALAWLPFLVVYVLARARTGSEDHVKGSGIAVQSYRAALVGTLPLLAFLLLRANAVGELEPAAAVSYVANPLYHVSPILRLANAVTVWGYGLFKLFWPWSLSSDYSAHSFDLVSSFVDVRFIAAFFVLIMIFVAGLLALRRHPLLFLASTAFLGFSFLTSNVPLPIGTMFAERLYFQPSMGLSFLVAWLLLYCRGMPRGRLVVHCGLAVWLTVSSVVCCQRMFDWRDDETLLLKDVRTQPRSLLLQRYCAIVMRNKKPPDFAAAQSYLLAALAIDREYAAAYNELGKLYHSQRDLTKAVDALEKGLAAKHTESFRDIPRLHYNLASVLMDLGRRVSALEHFEKALRASPRFFTGRLVSFASITEGRVDAPRLQAFYDLGVTLVPGDAQWLLMRGIISGRLMRYDSAIKDLEPSLGALARHPSRQQGLFVLAKSYTGVGRRQEAIAILQQLVNDPATPPEQKTVCREFLKALKR